MVPRARLDNFQASATAGPEADGVIRISDCVWKQASGPPLLNVGKCRARVADHIAERVLYHRAAPLRSVRMHSLKERVPLNSLTHAMAFRFGITGEGLGRKTLTEGDETVSISRGGSWGMKVAG